MKNEITALGACRNEILELKGCYLPKVLYGTYVEIRMGTI
jgi:hypothetical protein